MRRLGGRAGGVRRRSRPPATGRTFPVLTALVAITAATAAAARHADATPLTVAPPPRRLRALASSIPPWAAGGLSPTIRDWDRSYLIDSYVRVGALGGDTSERDLTSGCPPRLSVTDSEVVANVTGGAAAGVVVLPRWVTADGVSCAVPRVCLSGDTACAAAAAEETVSKPGTLVTLVNSRDGFNVSGREATGGPPRVPDVEDVLGAAGGGYYRGGTTGALQCGVWTLTGVSYWLFTPPAAEGVTAPAPLQLPGTGVAIPPGVKASIWYLGEGGEADAPPSGGVCTYVDSVSAGNWTDAGVAPPATEPADPNAPAPPTVPTTAPPPDDTVVTLPPPAGGEGAASPSPAVEDVPITPSPDGAAPTSEEDDRGSDGDNNPECFPADAAVSLDPGSAGSSGVVRAADLVWGTRVATPDAPTGGSSPLLVWTHADATARSCNFVTLTTAAGAAVTLTGGHLVPVGGVSLDRAVLTPARDVVEGDVVKVVVGEGGGAFAPSTVTTVERVCGVGLYSFHTTAGETLVVGGVVVSQWTAGGGARRAAGRAILRVLRLVAVVAGLGEGQEELFASMRSLGGAPTAIVVAAARQWLDWGSRRSL
ncbi:hypothetical protein MMPV_009663 [Pyropia vietnamensis]